MDVPRKTRAASGAPVHHGIDGRREERRSRARGGDDFRSAYLAAGVAMARLTPQGVIIDANLSFARLLKRSSAELRGARLLDLLHPSDADSMRAGRLSTFTGGTIRAELRFPTGEETIWGRASITLARRAGDGPDSLVMTVEDMTALKSQEAALEQERLHDPETGLPNLSFLSTSLTKSIISAKRSGSTLAVLLLEVGRPQVLREGLGSEPTDDLLAQLAVRLHAKVRPSDCMARTGANELAVVLGNVDEADLAAGVGRRLMRSLEPQFSLSGGGLAVPIGLGVAIYPAQGPSAELLLRAARMDMYTRHPAEPQHTGSGVGSRASQGATDEPATAGGASGVAEAVGGSTAALGEPVADAAQAPSSVEPAAVGDTEVEVDVERRVSMLETVSIFLALPDLVLRRIARYMSEQTAVAGAVVSGPDSPVALRIIQDGVCEISSDADPASVSLLTLGPGDILGFDALVLDNPLPVHVRAVTDCHFFVLDEPAIARAAPAGSAFRNALRVAAGQRDSHLRALRARPIKPAAATAAAQVAVYSTKGGSGRTTIALNMAAELGHRHPGEVLLVDMALPYNHVALLANLSPSTCLARISLATDDTFSKLAWGAVLPHPAGFMVLPTALRPEEAELVNPQLLVRAMNVLAGHFRYVLFDLGVTLDDNVLATLELSDHLILVATPELASMHDTRQVIDLATRVLHIPAGRVHTVLNNRTPDSAMSRKVVEEVLGREMVAEFRYLGARPELTGLQGSLQIQSDRGSPFSRAVRTLVDHVERSSPAAVRSA